MNPGKALPTPGRLDPPIMGGTPCEQPEHFLRYFRVLGKHLSMDSRARSVLKSHGYPCSGHNAHQIDESEIMSADLVIAAEPRHIQMMKRMAPDADNLRLIRDYDPKCTPGTSLPDPWYGSADGFEDTLDAIEAAMPGIVDEVRSLA